MNSTKLYDIQAKVRVKSNAKIYVGEIGIALLTSENLSFMVQFYKPEFGGHCTMWFDYEELEFL